MISRKPTKIKKEQVEITVKAEIEFESDVGRAAALEELKEKLRGSVDFTCWGKSGQYSAKSEVKTSYDLQY